MATADAWSAAAAKPTAALAPAWTPAALAKASSARTARITPKVFTPGAANTKATGGAPTGTWTPPASASNASGAQQADGAPQARAATTSGNASSTDGAATADGTPSGSFTPAKGTTSASPAALAASGDTSSAAPSQSLAASSIPSSAFGGAGASGAGLGLQKFYGLDSFALSTQLDASVNVANGNLVIHSRDLAINAPGLTMRIDQFFNLANVGQVGSGAAGYGGSLSTGQDIGLLVNGSGTGSTVTFFGPSGFTATFTATSSGAYTAPAGINADLVKNSDGTYKLTYRSSGEKLSFTAGGYLVSDVDRNGVGLSLSYDGSNRLTSITDGAGRVTTLSWNTNNTINDITDPAGRKVTYGYQNVTASGGGVKTITYADGAVVTIDNSRTGSLDGIQTPDGNWTYFDYTTGSKIAKITRFTTPGATSGAAAVTKYAYPSATSTVQTDPNGGQTTYTTDSSGRVTKVVDPLGHSREVTWTANSDLATAIDGLGTGTTPGNTLTYSYDSANNLTAVALPTGAAARASYVTGSACGSTTTSSSQGGSAYQPKCATDASGNTSSFTYDPAGNVLAVKDTTATASGGTGATPFTYTYQAASGGTASAGTACGAKTGQVCTATDGNANKTSYTYDASGNVTKITPPSPLGAVNLTYDSLGRVTSVIDGKGSKTTYEYDAYDRRTNTVYAAGTAAQKYTVAAYNADGNLTYLDDQNAGVSTWGYDALGRETGRKQPGAAQINSYYDAAGNLDKIDDIYGEVFYDYNAANQLTSMTVPTGSGSSAGSETTTFAYNNNGAETSRTLPNGIVTTTTRDNSGRPTEIKSAVGSTVIDHQKYSYTKPGASGASADRALVQTRTDVTGNNVPVNSTITYAYDGRSQLTSATEKTSAGAASYAWSYTYDKAGNRTKDVNGNTTTTYAYNAANEIVSKNGSTTGWASDANGNQTSGAWGTASFDARDALTSLTPAGGSAQAFGYAGDGNTRRLTNGQQKVINGPVGLQATIDANGAGTAYRYTPDGRRISAELPDGSSRYFLTDSLGSVVAVSNANTFTAKYSYDPYGRTRSTSGGEAVSNPFRYTGAYTDSNAGGLYKMGARYYEPVVGRFTQGDPSGQQINSFSYAFNSPTNFTDRSGLYPGLEQPLPGGPANVSDAYAGETGPGDPSQVCAANVAFAGIAAAAFTAGTTAVLAGVAISLGGLAC